MSLTKVSYAMIDGDAINALDYGADPTGATDSTAAIQAAVNAALGTASGTLWLPKGTYAVTSINIFPTGGKSIVLVGDGPLNSKFIKFGASTTPLLNVSGVDGGGGGSGVTSKCQFKNFGVQGTSKLFDGIYLDVLAHFFIEGVNITACDTALFSNGALIFSVQSCVFTGNNMGFEATAWQLSPFVGGSNLIKFSDCVFQANSVRAALLETGDQIVFQNCDFETNAVGVTITANFSQGTLVSGVTFLNSWFEGNTSDSVICSASDCFLNLIGCTLYGSAKSITVNGTDNVVTIQGCYGNQDLNMADATGSLLLSDSLFVNISISTPFAILQNVQSSAGRIQFASGSGAPSIIGSIANNGSGAALQVTGNSQATNGFLGKKQITVTTADVALVTVSLQNALVFVHGFNTTGGAQGWWLLVGTTVVQSSDATGTTPIFSFAGSVLNMRTTTGTLQINASALL
jgi:hypothetical protein